MAKANRRALTGDRARLDVAFQAAAQLEYIFLDLRRATQFIFDESDPDAVVEPAVEPVILNCVARRGLDLSRALLAAIQDRTVTTAELERMVCHG